MESDFDISVSDVLYPECHLDSPIVGGKLITSLEYANLTHNQPHEDQTLLTNINVNKKKKIKSPLISQQSLFGNEVNKEIFDLKNYYHVPYPECNRDLFLISDDKIAFKLSKIMDNSNKLFDGLERKLSRLISNVDNQLLNATSLHNNSEMDRKGKEHPCFPEKSTIDDVRQQRQTRDFPKNSTREGRSPKHPDAGPTPENSAKNDLHRDNTDNMPTGHSSTSMKKPKISGEEYLSMWLDSEDLGSKRISAQLGKDVSCKGHLHTTEDKPIIVPDTRYIQNHESNNDIFPKKEKKFCKLPPSSDNLTKIMVNSKWYNPFLFWFTVKTELRACQKENYKRKNRKLGIITSIKGSCYKLILNQNLVAIFEEDSSGYSDHKKRKKRCYYLTPEMVLMFSDVTEGRLMIDVAMRFDKKYKTLEKKALKLWFLIDELFPSMGNRVYNIISMLEPLTLAILQVKDESRLLRGAFMHHCLGDLFEELRESKNYPEDEIKRFANDLINVMTCRDIHLVAEFFSFFRTFGHPILNAQTAARKVREYMLADKILEYEPIMKGHAIFCAIIINGFRDRHGGVWPPLDLPKHCSKNIISLKNTGEGVTYEVAINNWRSFVGLKFKCFMGLNLDNDLSMYMKDKALSPLRDLWDSIYSREVMSYQPPRNKKSRRLVEVFVDDQDFDPVDMINYVLTGEYLRDDDFNASYSLKEKETKQVGRLFAKMTYKMRACQVIAENLIAHGIGRYFHENGMVKDEHELSKSLFQLSISGIPRGNKNNKSTNDTIHESKIENNHSFKNIQNRSFRKTDNPYNRFNIDNPTFLSPNCNPKYNRKNSETIGIFSRAETKSMIREQKSHREVKINKLDIGSDNEEQGKEIDAAKYKITDNPNPHINPQDQPGICQEDKGKEGAKSDLTEGMSFLEMHTLFNPSKSDIRTNLELEKSSLSNPGFISQKEKRGKTYNESHSLGKFSKEDEERYDVISAFLTTDLRKFCLNWRHESIGIFARRMDEIYGLPGFFNWMHRRLERSVLYVADPHCPPSINEHIDLNDSPERDIFIHHPKGGIEGYSQKLWTIATIPFLFLSAHETNTRIAAVVQGDNQSIAITHKVHPHLPYKMKKELSAMQAKKYFSRLRHNMKALGHELKATETIISTHFFIYSKKIHYDGAVLSQSLKSMARCVFWSETLVDETRAACSNISTTIAKAIENGYSRRSGYLINVLKTIQQINISLSFNINECMTDDIIRPFRDNPNWIKHAALIPASLGGLNYMNMSRLYVRNIGDPVTASIADVKRMILGGVLPIGILHNIMLQEPGDATYLDWCSDPYSINLKQTQSITKVIKNITARVILRNSVNPLLKGLFHEGAYEEDTELATFILDRRVILPRVGHEILNNSITGAREEISGLLDTTKGLIRIGIAKGGLTQRTLSRISNYDYEQFLNLMNMLKNKEQNSVISLSACSVDFAIALRSRMWRKLAKGRLIYGLEVPDPIEAMIGFLILGSENCLLCDSGSKNYTWFFIPKDVQLDKIDKDHASIRVPYVGSTTEERSEIKLGSVKNPSKSLKSAIRLATVYTWAFGTSDAEWWEAWYLSNQRANIPLDVLKTITPISTSTNIAHRLRDRSTQVKYASTSLNRVSRHVTISNDNMNFEFDGVKMDTNLIYQQVMLLGLSCLESLFRNRKMTNSYNIVYHLHVQEHCCVKALNDLPYTPSTHPVPNYTEVRDNRLIYDPQPILEFDELRLAIQQTKKVDLEFSLWDTKELHENLAQSLAITVTDIMTKSDKDHIKDQRSIDVDDNIKTLITEFLLVDPEMFAVNLGLHISIKWSFDIHFKRPRGRYSMIEYLTDLLDNTSSHVYRILTNVLSHPRVMRKFTNAGLLVPKYGPYLTSQDFKKMAVDFIITAYTTFLTNWCNNNKFSILIPEQDPDILELRKDITHARHLCMISDLYCYSFKQPWIKELTPQEKICVMEDFIANCVANDQTSAGWNITPLRVYNLPASTTYIRRGIIKQLRIRQSNEPIDLEDIRIGQNPDFVNKPIEFCSSEFGITIYNLEEILQSNVHLSVNMNIDSSTSNNTENHLFRRVGLNSTSSYKALSLTPVIKRYHQQNTNRLFIGEGSGSMMYLYQKTLGETICFFNSGVQYNEDLGQREQSLYPSEYSICEQGVKKENPLTGHVIPLFNGRPETTWVGNDDSFKYILEHTINRDIGLVHSDMETGIGKDNYTILNEHAHLIALSLTVMIDDGILVSKVAYAPGFCISSLLNMYRTFFSLVLCAFPPYSNFESTEFYLICLQKSIPGPITPARAIQQTTKQSREEDNSITNNILKIKNLVQKEFIKTVKKKYEIHPSFNCPINFTKDDKYLMSVGFQANGPDMIRKETGYDIGSNVENLRDVLIKLFADAVTFYDDVTNKKNFLNPYPVYTRTQYKILMDKICKKVTLYTLIISCKGSNQYCWEIKSQIRKHCLILDLKSKVFTKLIPKGLRERGDSKGMKSIWFTKLTSQEVKRWWKMISYIVIISNP
ncbi:polymerase [Cedar virus]|uniref:RNA-directed RNA polymerase L n=2 Tax=Paramyxoviridae TaxID=11158 RepID=J7GXK9_9MONO|nr:polymerase [Cedar virus]AFP87280.1 polymerase [Cedar virus]